MSEAVLPRSFSEAAAVLAGAASQGRPVRIVGGGTKLGWGSSTPPRALRIHTGELNRVVIHEGEATATINAGTTLVRAQSLFARSGLMLAADPQLGLGQRPAATLGGVVATADGGPLSHRYGPIGNQIAGVTVALSDGTIVSTGPRTDHQQDGYDIARLFAGSFGTLGLLLACDVHLRPLPRTSATALATTTDAGRLRTAVGIIVREHPDLEALDVAWRDGQGGLLAQLTGAGCEERAGLVAGTMSAAALQGAAVRTDDAGLWARQRAGQRASEHAILRVHARREELDAVLRAADSVGATVVGRAALGIMYLTLEVNRIAQARSSLPGGTGAVVLDLPAPSRDAIDPWGVSEGPETELMLFLKQRYDAPGVCNPGIFVGRI